MKAPGELEVSSFKNYILDRYGLEIQYHQHDKLVQYMQDAREQLKTNDYSELLKSRQVCMVMNMKKLKINWPNL